MFMPAAKNRLGASRQRMSFRYFLKQKPIPVLRRSYSSIAGKESGAQRNRSVIIAFSFLVAGYGIAKQFAPSVPPTKATSIVYAQRAEMLLVSPCMYK